jgi:uncharacterized membrane protein YfcA
MSWYSYPLLIAAGFVAGFINTLAGSGSAVTLPVLIFMGMPAMMANGTNRVAIVLQNVAGVHGFRQRGMLDIRGAAMLSIPAVIGSVIGARISLSLDEAIMRQTIGVVMLLMLVVIVLRPRRWLHGALEKLEGRPTPQQLLLFFFIGAYGGFIQVGVGIWLLIGLVLGLGYDLVRGNGVKVAIVFCQSVAALVVFILNGQVQWREGLVLAIGNVLGAWCGAWFAVEQGVIWVRRVLIAIVIFSATQLLGIWSWVERLL